MIPINGSRNEKDDQNNRYAIAEGSTLMHLNL
jgi:hypothetical protein